MSMSQRIMRSLVLPKLCIVLIAMVTLATQSYGWAYVTCNSNMPAGNSRYCTCVYIVTRNGDVIVTVHALFGCGEVANPANWGCQTCEDCPPADFWNLHGNAYLEFPTNNIGPIATNQ